MLEFSLDRDRDFLDLTPPKHYNGAINVGLLALFWWFGGCTFALLIHSFGSVYIAKSYDVCIKTTWKIIIKYPLDVTKMQQMDSRNQIFLGGHGPSPPPRRTRLWRVVCLRHTTCLCPAKPPLCHSLDSPLLALSLSLSLSLSVCLSVSLSVSLSLSFSLSLSVSLSLSLSLSCRCRLLYCFVSFFFSHTVERNANVVSSLK